MEFLKEILGDLYSGFESKVNEYNKANPEKALKLANLTDGGYVSKEKYSTLEETAKGYKEQVESANDQIQKFKDMNVEGIKQAAAEWEAKAKQAEKDSEAKIQKLEFDHALEKALTAAKARNTKAVQALLNMDELEFKDGAIVNLDKQLEGIKKENNYLFEAEAEKPVFSAKAVNTAPNPAGDSFLTNFRMGAGIKNKE